MKPRSTSNLITVALASIIAYGCAPKADVSSSSTDGNAAYCGHADPTSPVAGSTGSAKVFNIDPMVSANNATLSPGSTSLDSYTSSATLTNLLGYGTLKGNYVYVVTDRCIENGQPTYGAFSESNDFAYSHSDERFAETMNYQYGNLYRSELDAAGALYPATSFQMIANCKVTDNAYYTQKIVSGALIDYVCIGKSKNYATTNFSDDSEVFVHELQHGTTGNAYSTTEDFNKLTYDEAGAINEAISDFTALVQAEPSIASPFKAFEFSRWSLGQFFSESLMRGAAKCPVWTGDYPTCSNYSKTTAGFSASAKRVSFSYPDGLGWPYAGPPSSYTLRSVWQSSGGFEEIHQTAPIITGALYDAYIAAKGEFGSAQAARRAMYKLLMETIKVLPKASASDPSPVTMPVFASTMVSTVNSLGAPFDSSLKRNAVINALDGRGLITIAGVADGWASTGSTTHPNASVNHPGVFFYETKPTGIMNYRIQAGERGAVWFNVKNLDADSVAAPLLKVTISGSGGKVRFSNSSLNHGYVNSTTAFVRYAKINGSSYVSAVNNGAGTQNTGMTTDYFGSLDSNGFPYGVNPDTALYIEVDTTASGSFTFNVDIKSANSSSASHVESISFPVSF